MKLLLVSKEKFLIKVGYNLLGIPKEKIKIGYITTALKAVKNLEYLSYMKEYEKEMIEAKIDFEEFDIENKNEKEIKDFFVNKNVIQVTGGNVFYLLKTIRESGFDNVLKDLLQKGLCYVGCSAGAYIMCPTIEVGGWKTDRNKYGVTDFTALCYIPWLIKCHYKDELKEEIIQKMKTLKYSLKILRDDQGILVENDKYTFVGNGEEVKLDQSF